MQPNDTLTSVKFSGAEGLYVRFDNTKAILGSGCISKKKIFYYSSWPQKHHTVWYLELSTNK